MILDLIFVILSGILQMIAFAFGLIPFDVQLTQLSEAIAWLFAPLHYFSGVLDIDFLASMIRNLIIFEIAWFTYKIILGMINWIKLKGHHPTH